MCLLLASCQLSAQHSSDIETQIKAIQKSSIDTLRMDSLFHLANQVVDEVPRDGIAVCRVLLHDAESHNYLKGMANAKLILAIGYEHLADFPQSLHYYLDALEVHERLKLYHRQISICLGIARIYDVTGDQPKYKQYVLKAKEICERNVDAPKVRGRRSMITDALATVYKNQGHLDTAIVLYNKAIAYARETGDSSYVGAVLCNLATALKSDRQFAASLNVYDHALQLLDTNIYLDAHVVIGSNMALLFYEMGDLARSEAFALNALEQEKRVGKVDVRRDLYELLKKIYISKKRYPEAIEYFTKLAEVKDTILNRAQSQQIKELQAKYDTEAKDKQISSQQVQLAYNRKINFFLGLVSVLLLLIGVLAFISQRRTAQLNKLIISQKQEVEQLNDVKDRILSVISHDMRTPVNTLIAFTQLLESGNISPEKMTVYAATLKNNLGYTARLMENLLNWARTQMEGFKPVQERFDLAASASQVVGLLQPEAEKKGLMVQNEIPALALVFADINMTALLMRNLLSNAIKYTSSGGVIHLSALSVEGMLRVNVSDSGIGIVPELVTRFNSSHTGQPLENTPGTNQEKGTGLGLMLCKNFIALMNGKISLESEVGKGSCFTFELPLA